jgi:hypothetical protein
LNALTRKTDGTLRLVAALALAGLVGIEAVGTGVTPACAQPSNDAVLEEKISRLRAFREHLKSADDIERAEAYQTGLTDDDPIVREMTSREAFRSKYSDLRNLALRGWLSSHSTIIVQLTLPKGSSEATGKAYDNYLGRGLLLAQLKINPKNEITLFDLQLQMGFAGQFSQGGVVLIGAGGGLGSCSLELRVNDETSMSGALRCRGLDPLVATVNLT